MIDQNLSWQMPVTRSCAVGVSEHGRCSGWFYRTPRVVRITCKRCGSVNSTAAIFCVPNPPTRHIPLPEDPDFQHEWVSQVEEPDLQTMLSRLLGEAPPFDGAVACQCHCHRKETG